MNFKKTLLSSLMLSSTCLAIGHSQTLQDAVQLAINENPEIQELKKIIPKPRVSSGQAVTDNLAVSGNALIHAIDSDNSKDAKRSASVKPVKVSETASDEGIRVGSKVDAKIYTVLGYAEATALQASQAYINVLRRHALVNLAQANVELHKRFVDQAGNAAGESNHSNSVSKLLKARFEKAEAYLQKEQALLKDVRGSYLKVIGVPPKHLADVPKPHKVIPENLEKATEFALANYSTFKSGHAEQLFLRHSVSLPVRSKSYNVVEWQSNVATKRGNSPAINALVATPHVGNVFVSLKNDHSDSKHSTFDLYKAAHNQIESPKQVAENMSLVWDAYNTSVNQLEYFKVHRESSNKNFRITKQRYENAQATLADLLDAANEMYLANSTYLDAKHTELTARYRILAGMGVLNYYLETYLPNVLSQAFAEHNRKGKLYTVATEPKRDSHQDLDIYKSFALAANYNVNKPQPTNAQATAPVPQVTEAPVIKDVTKDITVAKLSPKADKKTDTESTQDEIALKQQLFDWSAAWSRGEVDTYLSFYTDDFTPNATVSHDAWKKLRTDRINAAKQITIAITQLTITPDKTQNAYTTMFRQAYNASNYHDKSTKVLTWKKVGDTWKIQEEKTIK